MRTQYDPELEAAARECRDREGGGHQTCPPARSGRPNVVYHLMAAGLEAGSNLTILCDLDGLPFRARPNGAPGSIELFRNDRPFGIAKIDSGKRHKTRAEFAQLTAEGQQVILERLAEVGHDFAGVGITDQAAVV